MRGETEIARNTHRPNHNFADDPPLSMWIWGGSFGSWL
jgi:hypothetical protein